MDSQGSRKLVACCGDSITRGQVSGNYVSLLDHGLKSSGYEFVNHGVNGDLAYNVAQRLDGVVSSRPDVVTLLVGTNDVNAHFDDKWQRRYIKGQKLPTVPDRDWYAENVDRILARLQSETSARIAVIEIPILGEDLSSRMNALVNEYNEALHELAAQHGVACLPLNARLKASLPANHKAPPYEGSVSMVAKAGMRHGLLRRKWDDISRHNGLALLTDHIHLNDTAAAVVSKLIKEFVSNPTTQTQPTASSPATEQPQGTNP